jgi:hypothetical protein
VRNILQRAARHCVRFSQFGIPHAMGFHLSILAMGYFVSATLGLFGLARRRLLHCAWALLLIPIYWVLLSIAVWRALIQLVHDPYRWEKTMHGLARTSRLMPHAPDLLRNIAADRPRRRRASASR